MTPTICFPLCDFSLWVDRGVKPDATLTRWMFSYYVKLPSLYIGQQDKIPLYCKNLNLKRAK
jgi:hypothetical protein